ncbi:hypothetical protein SteCoe_10026 [Stentor coeruleus]|uniref:Palmitoyltransferase n=1 Tax=Stentor coeruleus TaxID=5963 RepID=A0A1R2CGK1_9CILI|nr:hypothetical protein SteCoe_10026 [Stentor coeruleus]
MLSKLDEESEFFQLLSNENLIDIMSFLKRSPSLNIMNLTQQGNFTVLHFLASNRKFTTVDFILNFCKSNYNLTQEELKSWLDKTANTDEELTCTHMAILAGQLQIVKLFYTNGADLHKNTKSGMTPMHLAAKTDQILLMAWLREFKDSDEKFIFSDKKTDENNFTPLHYAAMLSCELSTSVLLSWGASVKEVNKKGQTPLHLAVTSGSSRIVRSLLIKGADVNARDYSGKTPLEEALETKNEEIINSIKSPGLLSICGIKPPQRPIMHRRLLLSIFVFFLFIGISFIYIGLKTELENLMFSYYYEYLCLAEFFFFFLASQLGPGYLDNNKENMLIKLAEKYESSKICFNCFILRIPRSGHCFICNLCVERFDHHHPWINNCIGAKNHCVFYIFLVITCVFIPYTAFICIYYLVLCLQNNYDLFNIKSLLALIITVICMLFSVLVYMLFAVQTKNIYSNTTTNERYSRKTNNREYGRSDSDMQVNRENILSNCLEMCCDLNIYKRTRHDRDEMIPLLCELK